MKIIGFGEKEGYERKFIFEINQKDLEKLLGSYYSKKIPGIDKIVSELNPGDIIDVSLLHDMTSTLTVVANKMFDTMEAFKKSQDTLLKFTETIINVKEN